MTAAPVQLLTFAFGPDAVFEGQMLGAVERLESGGALRIVQVIFVRRDAADGTLSAFAHRGGTAGGIAGPGLEFRLDEDERRRADLAEATKRTGGIAVSSDFVDAEALARELSG